jgi:hypothetical protein
MNGSWWLGITLLSAVGCGDAGSMVAQVQRAVGAPGSEDNPYRPPYELVKNFAPEAILFYWDGFYTDGTRTRPFLRYHPVPVPANTQMWVDRLQLPSGPGGSEYMCYGLATSGNYYQRTGGGFKTGPAKDGNYYTYEEAVLGSIPSKVRPNYPF